ncbi:1857_t:CDS:1, partial [Gigaspora rosea]
MSIIRHRSLQGLAAYEHSKLTMQQEELGGFFNALTSIANTPTNDQVQGEKNLTKTPDNLYGFVPASSYCSFSFEIQDNLLAATSVPLSQDTFELLLQDMPELDIFELNMPEPPKLLLQDSSELLSQYKSKALRSALIELDQNVHISQIEMQ